MRHEVVAACREPEHARELEALTRDSGNGRIVRLDVSDPASVRQAAEVIESHTGRVDLLINCAATGATAGFDAAATGGPLSAVRAEAMLEVFRVNTVGPALVTQALSPLLGRARESRIVNITSDLGSLTRDVRPGSYAYAMSKAALNMLARKLAAELGSQDTVVIALHPGAVRTDMGGPRATLSPADSVRGMLAVIARVQQADTGRGFTYAGETLPW